MYSKQIKNPPKGSCRILLRRLATFLASPADNLISCRTPGPHGLYPTAQTRSLIIACSL